MSVAKVKVAQNRQVCDHSERKLQACSIHILYSLSLAKNIEIAVDLLCHFPNSKRGYFKRKNTLK